MANTVAISENQKIKGYDIVHGNSMRELADQVREALGKGWQPYGQLLSVSGYYSSIFGEKAIPGAVFAQAIVFYGEAKPKNNLQPESAAGYFTA